MYQLKTLVSNICEMDETEHFFSLDMIIPKMFLILNNIVNAGPEKFDLERIHNFIDREVLQHKKNVENSPKLFVPDASVLSFLYGETPHHLEEFVLSSTYSNDFRNKSAVYWLDLLKNVFLESRYFVIKGIPSSRKLEQIKSEEDIRLQARKILLGENILMQKQKSLEEAIESQIPPSNKVLQEIPVGNIDTIRFRPIKSFNSSIKTALFNFEEIPFKLHIDDVKSQFVQLYLFMDTTVLTQREKSLLPLLSDIWFLSPLQKNNYTLSIGEATKIRAKNFLSLSNSLGFRGTSFSPGAFADAFIIKVKIVCLKQN